MRKLKKPGFSYGAPTWAQGQALLFSKPSKGCGAQWCVQKRLYTLRGSLAQALGCWVLGFLQEYSHVHVLICGQKPRGKGSKAFFTSPSWFVLWPNHSKQRSHWKEEQKNHADFCFCTHVETVCMHESLFLSAAQSGGRQRSRAFYLPRFQRVGKEMPSRCKC